MTTKDRKEMKHLMTRISNTAGAIRRAVHECRMGKETQCQMTELPMLIEKATTLMETIKPQQPNGNDALQGVLLDLDSAELVSGKVVITPNGKEPSEEVTEEE